MVKKKKKYRKYKGTSFRQGGEDYALNKNEKSSGLAASSSSYKDHYDAA